MALCEYGASGDAYGDGIYGDTDCTPVPTGRGCCNGRNRRCCRRNRATLLSLFMVMLYG